MQWWKREGLDNVCYTKMHWSPKLIHLYKFVSVAFLNEQLLCYCQQYDSNIYNTLYFERLKYSNQTICVRSILIKTAVCFLSSANVCPDCLCSDFVSTRMSANNSAGIDDGNIKGDAILRHTTRSRMTHIRPAKEKCAKIQDTIRWTCITFFYWIRCRAIFLVVRLRGHFVLAEVHCSSSTLLALVT